MSKKDMIIDTLEIVAKTAISAIPVGGPLATAIYDTVKENALAQRQKKWMAEIEQRIAKTEETLESIGNNQLFTTALLKATELAIKSAKDEKIKYLANAVVNSLNADLDEEKLIIFLNLLEKYTVSHIKIINFFNDPTRFEGVPSSQYMMGSPSIILFQVYPELDNYLFDKIYNDLYVDGMVSLEHLKTSMTGRGMVAKRTTELADDFLQFIMADAND